MTIKREVQTLYNIVTVTFKDSNTATANGVRQWDYGQILRIQGLQLPTAVEVHFALIDSKDSVTRIGITKDGVTDVVIPDSMIEAGKNIFAYVYLRDSESGQTEYEIKIVVTTRAKPEAFDTPEDKELFAQAIEAVNTAADRAEKAEQSAQEAAQKAGLDAEQTAQDRAEVAKMVETVTDISEQVKKVEDLSNKAQAAATKTEADAQQTAEDRVEVGKMLETVKDVSEQVKTVDESVRKAKESERAAEGHRTAVEEMKNSVEQTVSGITQVVQTGVQEINSAKQSAVQEVTQTGTAQKTAVESAGTQAVENVENAQQAATEAVETAKTEAVQSVQTEGTKQTGNVSAEGAKQIKEVQDKGAEVLQSIPEDFATQMETKLNKQQGIENKGKVLVIEEDGNVVPGEVASGGGDGIAIVNTTSGESPLVIPDSAERVNKGFGLTGKTEQVQTTGKNLLPDKFSIYAEGKSKTNLKLQIGNYVYSSKTSKNLYILHEDKSNITNGWTATNKLNFKIDKEETIEVRIETENPLEILPMIREETELDSYEPYTGGKPSPSQEYQQEVKNTGKLNADTQKYEVGVKVTGKNLFDREKAKDVSNWISIEGDGYLKFPIRAKKGSMITFSYEEKLTEEKKFYLGIAHSERGGFIAWLYHNVTSSLSNNKYTTVATNDYVYLMCNKNAIQNFLDTIQTLQAEISQTQTNYQPYKEQTLTLTSDRPITKWDRLVEQGGEIGWLYGGKIIDSYNSEQIDAEYMSSTGSLTVGATVLYKLKTTEFVPIPQSEQNAIRALKTYYPTTVITADGGELDPDIKVTYTADTKNYIDGKVSAKVASILRQYQADTANLLSLMPMETQATMIENDTNNILNNLESEEAHE